jgi:hypothetical protein
MQNKTIKKKLEKDIQREICDYLHEQGYFFWRQNNTPIFDRKFGGFRAMTKYTPKGLPDILILKNGKFIGLEVKVPDYWKFTDDQINMRENFHSHGGYYYLVTSLIEAQDIMSKF